MKRMKRILAIIGIVIILGLYIITFLSAIFVKQVTGTLFLSCLVVTVMVPVILYLALWLYQLFHREDRTEEWEAESKKGFQEAARVGKKHSGDDTDNETLKS